MTLSAAEVMGWDRARLVAAESVTLEGHDTYKPTPDDMLAWLKDRGAYLAACDDHLNGNYGVQVSTLPDTFTAPTLHAALEAAVIAVGRAE